jgi:hypothetical protein
MLLTFKQFDIILKYWLRKCKYTCVPKWRLDIYKVFVNTDHKHVEFIRVKPGKELPQCTRFWYGHDIQKSHNVFDPIKEQGLMRKDIINIILK